MTRQITALALLLGTALPSTAAAQSWGDFAKAFPLFPCQDGWVGCIVDGEAISPEMQPDSSGAPIPSNMRVGWFDLQATASFSPFVALSEYTGELPGMAVAEADVEPPPPPEPVAPPEPTPEEIAANKEASRANAEAKRMEAESRAAEQAAKAAAAEQEAQRKAAADAEKRKKELEAQAKAAASAAEAEALRKQAEEQAKMQKAAEEARKKAEAEAKKREEERIAKAKAEDEARKKAAEAEAARLAAEAEAEKQAAEAARVAAAEAAKKKAAADAAAAATKTAAVAAADQGKAADADVPAGSETCEPSELVRLEPQAMLGKLSVGQLKACEGSLGTATKMTDKEKISRVLMVNAFSKGDKATWEQLVKRHLDEIDQSDPDLCYKYALHLSKQGAGRATGVIRWANVALENRTIWSGDTYTSRVYSLYKLRAAAAQLLWQKAESDHAAAPSDTTKKKSEDYRAQTKVLAREWYEYAKVAGKDTTTALQLCMSAAGTADYCEAQ